MNIRIIITVFQNAKCIRMFNIYGLKGLFVFGNGPKFVCTTLFLSNKILSKVKIHRDSVCLFESCLRLLEIPKNVQK